MGALKKIVILHGWTYALDKWINFTHLLEKEGFEVYLPNIPGLTEKSNEIWNLDKYTDWLNKLLVKYEDKIILLGHSNGGRIAISYAAKYPDKLEKLILIDSAGIYHKELFLEIKRFVFKVAAKLGKKLTNSSVLRKFLYNLSRERDYDQATDAMKKTMINLIKIDVSPLLEKIRVKTILIWGVNDRTTPLEDAYLMNKLIAGSKLNIVREARHPPFYTHPKEVIEIIKNDI